MNITGPGNYRTYDGQLVKIGSLSAMTDEWLGILVTSDGRTQPKRWKRNGDGETSNLDIVGRWHERKRDQYPETRQAERDAPDVGTTMWPYGNPNKGSVSDWVQHFRKNPDDWKEVQEAMAKSRSFKLYVIWTGDDQLLVGREAWPYVSGGAENTRASKIIEGMLFDGERED